jgi:hypothetical protein
MGEASGINYLTRRLRTDFAVAIIAAVSAGHGHLGSAAAATARFRPSLRACVSFADLATLSGMAITSPHRQTSTNTEPAELPIATRTRNNPQPPRPQGARR